MTNYITKNLKQKAIYWKALGMDGYGAKIWGTPIEINCRWEDTTQLIMANNGEQILCRAVVQVDRDLVEGSMLWLGLLDDLTQEEKDNPKLLSRAYSIKRFDKVPDIKARNYFRRCYL